MKGLLQNYKISLFPLLAETMNNLQALECLTTVMQQPLSMLIVA